MNKGRQNEEENENRQNFRKLALLHLVQHQVIPSMQGCHISVVQDVHNLVSSTYTSRNVRMGNSVLGCHPI